MGVCTVANSPLRMCVYRARSILSAPRRSPSGFRLISLRTCIDQWKRTILIHCMSMISSSCVPFRMLVQSLSGKLATRRIQGQSAVPRISTATEAQPHSKMSSSRVVLSGRWPPSSYIVDTAGQVELCQSLWQDVHIYGQSSIRLHDV